MGFLKYSRTILIPKACGLDTTKQVLDKIGRVIRTKRVTDLVRQRDRLVFRNLYLKRADLIPVPSGEISVGEDEGGFRVTYSADYRWLKNRQGRWWVYLLIGGMLAIALARTYVFFLSYQDMPPYQTFLIIPILAVLFWHFVNGINCLYSRLYIGQLIRMNFRQLAAA